MSDLPVKKGKVLLGGAPLKTLHIELARTVYVTATIAVPASTTEEEAQQLALQYDKDGLFSIETDTNNADVCEVTDIGDYEWVWEVELQDGPTE